tara:strand:+ start:89227 stop:90261 length:1035 start_codon:yes stop_codon:yes gene_type:complete
VQENKMQEDDSAVSDSELRVWHQADTLTNIDEWPSDTLKQITLDLQNFSESILEVSSDAPTYLFSGEKLIEKSENNFLKYSFKSVPTEQINISWDEKLQNMSFGVYSIENPDTKLDYQGLENSSRENKWISDNILLILLIGASLFMVIVKANYDKRYLNILSISKIFTFRLKEGDQSRIRIMDQDNLVFAGLYVFLTAGLIYFLIMGKGISFLEIESNGILAFIKIISIISIGLIGKVILVAVASNLFGNNRISAFYIKELLNINLFFVNVLFFTSILIYLYVGSIPSIWLTIAIYGIVALYLARLILIYFKILKLSSFSNLYLFSYFCTTEIFPFLIGLKYFI